MNKNLGFTLLEILVVISMISLISGLGFLSLSEYSKSQVIKQSAEDLKQSVNLARFNAVSSVKPQTSLSGQLCTSADQLVSYNLNFCNNTTCISTSPNINYEVVASCGAKSIVVSAKSLQKGLIFSNTGIDSSFLCTSVVFEARSGVITGAPCQINITNGSSPVTVSISEGGNAYIQ